MALGSTKRDQSLTHAKRLHYPWEYRRFFNGSEVFRLSECVVFRIGNSLGYPRLGITLKIRASSVQRNRIKRQIRESFRTMAPALGSHDYNVVVPQTKRAAHPYPERLAACLKKELPHALPSS